MSDIVNPKLNPQLAAQQLVVELIRAERLGSSSSDRQAQKVISAFEEIEKYFTDKYQSSDDPGVF